MLMSSRCYNEQAAALACAARLMNASRSLETPFGRLTCVIDFLAFNNFNFNVYGAIDNENVRRNRIGQNVGKDNGSMVCRTKLLNQLGVTAPIESLHNLIETLKSDRPRHFVTLLRN